VSTSGADRSALRVVRGGLLAFSSAALAVSAHALAGAGLPDASMTVVLTILIGWIATALAGRTRGPLGALALLAPAQLLMHVVLGALMAHPGGPGTATGGVHGAAMTAAHAAATVLTAALVAHAESMLRIAVASLRLLLPVVWTPAPIPAAAPAPPLPHRAGTDAVTVVLRRVRGRRGPPTPS
jgi:hypothetical protein